jgi:hypothetical protein
VSATENLQILITAVEMNEVGLLVIHLNKV